MKYSATIFFLLNFAIRFAKTNDLLLDKFFNYENSKAIKTLIDFREPLLSSDSHKATCFQQASQYVKPACDFIRDKDSGTDEVKVLLALHLTECELQTADEHLPNQCRIYLNQFAAFSSNLRNQAETNFIRGQLLAKWSADSHAKNTEECVQALSKASQFWTSYSGYYRNVHSACKAIRSDVDKQFWQSIYRNWTDAQLLHYRLLKAQNGQIFEWVKDNNVAISAISTSQQNLLESTESLVAVSNTTLKKSNETLATILETRQNLDDLKKLQSDLSLLLVEQSRDVRNLGQQLSQRLAESNGAVSILNGQVYNVSNEMKLFVEMHAALSYQLSALTSSTKQSVQDNFQFALQLRQQMNASFASIVSRFKEIEQLQQSQTGQATAFYEKAMLLWNAQAGQLKRTGADLSNLQIGLDHALKSQSIIQAQLQNMRTEHKLMEQAWAKTFGDAHNDIRRLTDISKRNMEQLAVDINKSNEHHRSIMALIKPLISVVDGVANNLAIVGTLAITAILAIFLYIFTIFAPLPETKRYLALFSICIVTVIHFYIKPAYGWVNSLMYSLFFLGVFAFAIHLNASFLAISPKKSNVIQKSISGDITSRKRTLRSNSKL